MWHRRRVTSFAWTHRALDVQVVVRNAPPVIAEILEDRTLLSGIATTPGSDVSWADLLGSDSSLSFSLPIDVVSGLTAKGFDDKSAGAEKEMRSRERHYLRQLGLPDISEL